MASLFPTISNALDRVIPGMDNKRVASKMEEQSASLKSITKILVKNNDDLRKDVTDLRKEFILGTSEFSRMRQYFEKTDNAKPAEKVKERENRDDSPGILKRLINSLTRKGSPNEPREIELKTLEELRLLKTLTDKSARDIEFIRESFTESSKKKDRELLAQAIASKLDMDGGRGGGGFMGGIAAALGILGATLTTFGTSIAKLLSDIPSLILRGISTIPSLIMAGLAGLTTLLSKGIKIGFDLAKGAATAVAPALKTAAMTTANIIRAAAAFLISGPGLAVLGVGGVAALLGYLLTSEKTQYGDTKTGSSSADEGFSDPTAPADSSNLVPPPPSAVPLPPSTVPPKPSPAGSGDTGEIPGVTVQPNAQPELSPIDSDPTKDILGKTVDAVKEQTQLLREKLMGSSGLFEFDDMLKDGMNSPLGKFALDKIKGLGELQFDDGKMNLFSGLPSVINQLYDKGMKESQELQDAIAETFKENPPMSVSNSTVVTGGSSQQMVLSDANPNPQSPSFISYLKNKGSLR
jgi:hypothetical protein